MEFEHTHKCLRCKHEYTPTRLQSEDCPNCGFGDKDMFTCRDCGTNYKSYSAAPSKCPGCNLLNTADKELDMIPENVTALTNLLEQRIDTAIDPATQSVTLSRELLESSIEALIKLNKYNILIQTWVDNYGKLPWKTAITISELCGEITKEQADKLRNMQ